MTLARLPGLDGLRAIAVAAVVLFHVVPTVVPAGYAGVDVFFVVSGYLIATLSRHEHDTTGTFDARAFWVRRARRLLPALGLMVPIIVGLAWLLASETLAGVGLQLLGAVTFTSNWVELATAQDYFAAAAPRLFGNLWSLGVEEQFYALWPLLALLVLRLRRRLATVMLAVSALGSIAMQLFLSATGEGSAAYFHTVAHIFGLLLGCATAMALPTPGRLSAVGMAAHLLRWSGIAALIGIAMVFAASSSPAPLARAAGLVLVTILTTVVLLSLAAANDGALLRILEARPVRWLGQRSYGVYLWHFPLIVIADVVFAPTVFAGRLPGRIDAVFLTIVLAALSYRFVEVPVRRLGFRGASTTLGFPPASRRG